MRRLLKRRTVVVGLVIGLILLGSEAALIVVDAFDPVSEKGHARAWVQRNAANLPSTYEELSHFPAMYRKAIFQGATPEIKSALMRSQLQAALSTHTLSAVQRSFVEEFAQALEPSAYQPTSDNKPNPRLVELCNRSKQLFPKELARIFAPAMVFGEEPLGGLRIAWVSTRASLAASLRFILPDSLRANEIPDNCDCLLDSWCPGNTCSAYEGCTMGEIGGMRFCQPVTPGCGCGGVWGCPDFCYDVTLE